MKSPGEELIIKLWESLVDKGIGGLLKPWQIRREGLAQAEVRRAELVMLADAEKQAEAIRSGRLKLADSKYALALTDTAADEPARSPVVEATISGVVSDALRREVNVAKAITYAEAQLEADDDAPPAASIESDWLYRWRDHVGSISSAELQALWGRLMAGELKAPGSYSYRTLDFIKNLSRDEAQKIERLGPFLINNFVARDEKGILDKHGVGFGDLLELQELGVLSGVDGIGLSLTLDNLGRDSFLAVLRSHSRALVLRHSDPTRDVSIAMYPLTTLGAQIVSLAESEPNDDYLEAVGKRIAKGGITVSIGDIFPAPDNKSIVRNERPVEG